MFDLGFGQVTVDFFGGFAFGFFLGIGRDRIGRKGIVQRLVQGLGHLVVFFVIRHLFVAAVVGPVDGFLHGAGNGIGIHDGLPVDVPRGSPHGLGEGTVGAEETFFVGIQDSDQRNLGQVQTFPQEVYANQDIEEAFAQVLHNFYPF